jgi:hypothetical protein
MKSEANTAKMRRNGPCYTVSYTVLFSLGLVFRRPMAHKTKEPCMVLSHARGLLRFSPYAVQNHAVHSRLLRQIRIPYHPFASGP